MFPARLSPRNAPHHAHRRASRALAIALLLPVAGAGAADPGFSYPNFTSPTSLSTQGAAGLSGSVLRLTPSQPQLSGAAWHTNKLPVAAGFTSSFTFRASDMGGSGDAAGHVGADGFAFVIQPVSSSAVVLGANGHGGNIGYSTLPRAVVIEFDTWFNGPATANEPDGHHIALLSGGLGPVTAANDTLAVASLPSTIADGLLHDIVIDYDGSMIDISVDSLPAFSAPIDLGAVLGLGDGLAFVGFTAATGGGWENHDILQWEFASVPGPGAAGTLALGAAALMRRRRPA